MRYMGGKSRLAKSIRDVILQRVPSTDVTYWEPFVGGCGSFEIIAPEFTRSVGSDLHEDLILMWDSVIKGWEPPQVVSQGRYKELRDEAPSAERGFVGFGGSFSGKWFGGYAKGGFQSNGEPRNHQAESARNVLRTRNKLEGKNVTFRLGGYGEITPQSGDVVYCDPPYKGTSEYKDAGFNSDSFYTWAENLAAQGVYVFVSEYEAPEGWTEIYRKERLSSTDLASKRKTAVDRLFTYRVG